MKRSERMEKIVTINTGYENMAGATLASAQTEHQSQLNQLDQLKIYKQEYQLQLKQRMSNSITSKEIQDFQFFFASLDDAIAQQVVMVKRSATQVDLTKAEWLEKKKEVKKISRIAENLKKEEYLLESRKEQKETDELSQLLATLESKLPIKH